MHYTRSQEDLQLKDLTRISMETHNEANRKKVGLWVIASKHGVQCRIALKTRVAVSLSIWTVDKHSKTTLTRVRLRGQCGHKDKGTKPEVWGT